MLRSLLVTITVAAASLLSACNAEPAIPATSVAPAIDPYAATAEAAKGFASGNQMATRTVYVYFDTQCPHCGKLWETMKALNGSVKVVWIPVGILNPASVSQGAALLASADPTQAMNAHESQLLNGGRGMSASAPTSAQSAVIKANTKLLQAVGGDSVPFIVAKNAKTGALVKQPGALPEAALRELLGTN